jgi:hypothetical protein
MPSQLATVVLVAIITCISFFHSLFSHDPDLIPQYDFNSQSYRTAYYPSIEVTESLNPVPSVFIPGSKF